MWPSPAPPPPPLKKILVEHRTCREHPCFPFNLLYSHPTSKVGQWSIHHSEQLNDGRSTWITGLRTWRTRRGGTSEKSQARRNSPEHLGPMSWIAHDEGGVHGRQSHSVTKDLTHELRFRAAVEVANESRGFEGECSTM